MQNTFSQIGRSMGTAITKSHNFILPPGQYEAVIIDLNKGYLVGAHRIGRADDVKTCCVGEGALCHGIQYSVISNQ
jgi:hypothetical protein